MAKRWLWRSLHLMVALLLLLGLIRQVTSKLASQRGEAIIFIAQSLEGEAAISLAVDDLKASLKQNLGLEAKVVLSNVAPSKDDLLFIIGDEIPPALGFATEVIPRDPLDIGEEGYLIESLPRTNALPAVLIRGGIRGSAFAIFRLAEEVALDPSLLSRPIHFRAEPQMTFRLIANPLDATYPTPQDALRWGFNAIAIEPWPALALYGGFDPAIYDPTRFPESRAWVEGKRRQARARIAEAKGLNLMVVSPGDVLSFPKQTLALYGDRLGGSNEAPLFCIGQALTRQLLSAATNEVLNDFPEIDAIMVRTGENYPQGPLVGNTPTADCNDGSSPLERLRQTMTLIGDEVSQHHAKLYIQRAWDVGQDGFHASPQVATQVLDGLPHWQDRLLISFKNTQTDFWRYNPTNLNLATLALPRMVEYQAAREYEGKGAFPNYLGELYAYGPSEMSSPGGLGWAYRQGVRALWVWPEGGGWGGPHPVSNLWVEANVYALSHLAWDTSADPAALARNWATLRFGREAAPAMARLLLRSDEATLKAFYSGPFAAKHGSWAPNLLWVRDDVIFGGDRLAAIYEALDEAERQIALDEKRQAMRLVDEMIADFDEVRPFIADPTLAETVANTLRYEKALVDTLSHYFSGIFRYHQWLDGDQADEQLRQEARQEFEQWRASWKELTEEVALLPGVATSYYSWGMVETVEAALADLEAGP